MHSIISTCNAGRVVLNEFATPPQGLLAYAQQVSSARCWQHASTARLIPCAAFAVYHNTFAAPHVYNAVDAAVLELEKNITSALCVACLPSNMHCCCCRQAIAPFGALLSRHFPLSPMTDNACVSIHAVGPAAAHSNSNGAACLGASHSSSSSTAARGGHSSGSTGSAQGGSVTDQVQLLAITEDPWGSYLVHPDTLQTLQQVGT